MLMIKNPAYQFSKRFALRLYPVSKLTVPYKCKKNLPCLGARNDFHLSSTRKKIFLLRTFCTQQQTIKSTHYMYENWIIQQVTIQSLDS